MTISRWSEGSRWLRWDPHIHAPGTLLNNNFGSDWDSYIAQINNASPSVVALGVTDYYTLRGYKEIVQRRESGALPGIELLFANVELRLTIETRNGSGINLHLLVSPEDPQHVKKIEGYLSDLKFKYKERHYRCTEDDLRDLGRAANPTEKLTDESALQKGANQFKVDFGKLRELFDTEVWLRENVIIAVAAGNDGLAGLAKDSGFRAYREEVARFAAIIFSGNPSDRKYWLGGHDDFEANSQHVKPCLHGSDAHSLAKVLAPDLDRYCWIRAEPTFEGLRQVIAEPSRRVHIGERPPEGPIPSEVIRSISWKKSPWMATAKVVLNDGLVSIIGEKGSGKTALADLLAVTADAVDTQIGEASFLRKAGELLDGVEIELTWGDGQKSSVKLPYQDAFAEPRVRYLSQQFVEQICSPVGVDGGLRQELEQVVFNAIPVENRLGCYSFGELRSAKLAGPESRRETERITISNLIQQIAGETALIESAKAIESRLARARIEVAGIEKSIKEIPVKAEDKVVNAHKVALAYQKKLKEAVATEETKSNSLAALQADVKKILRQVEIGFADLKKKYDAVLSEEDWLSLRPRIDEGAEARLIQLQTEARKRAANLLETGNPEGLGQELAPESQGLNTANAEVDRLTKELGLDAANARRRTDLEKRLGDAKATVQREGLALKNATDAFERRRKLQADRLDAYERVFTELSTEKTALEELYAPLRDRIAIDAKLEKLSFKVRRYVNLAQWVERGERMFDLRRPPFQGHGVLAEIAKKVLLPAWSKGSPEDVRKALLTFVEDYASKAVAAKLPSYSLHDFGEWLYSTNHIEVRYEVLYEGVELAHLSPGTRGVVLLTLYLGLDDSDHRPLIVDQPEENLDPRSVFSVLVPFFQGASKRRQIIMVTHNANLVVNTDSDQVVIAKATRTTPNALPTITYQSGGLETLSIREQVCSLLEGGEEAFKRRSQRYGVDRIQNHWIERTISEAHQLSPFE